MTATAAKATVTALRASTGYRQLTWDDFQPVITTGKPAHSDPAYQDYSLDHRRSVSEHAEHRR
jgi:hypothetical protein